MIYINRRFYDYLRNWFEWACSDFKLLKDKRLAAGNNFGTLNIYDLFTYKPDIIIENLFNKWISNINQLSNGQLITSSYNIVKIIKIAKNKFTLFKALN